MNIGRRCGGDGDGGGEVDGVVGFNNQCLNEFAFPNSSYRFNLHSHISFLDSDVCIFSAFLKNFLLYTRITATF